MRHNVFAHRGSSGTHPENTLAAIHDAIAAGVDGIEIDVQKTSDGKLVVIHDERVERTTNGSGFIKDMKLHDIKKLDAGSWFSPKYKLEKIPELHEVLDILHDQSILLNIELKNNDIDYPELEQDVYQAIKKHNMIDRVIISSFNHQSLATFSKLFPEVTLAILIEKPIDQPQDYLEKLGASTIHCDLNTYKHMVKLNEGMDLSYRIFTVNNGVELAQWAALDEYDIFTDFPREALKAKA